jgi:hypothetical protein
MGAIPVKLVPKLAHKDGTKLMGYYRSKDRVIQLRPAMHPKAMQQTLWHEWIHAILIDAGAQPADKDQAEAVCDALGTALAALFT